MSDFSRYSVARLTRLLALGALAFVAAAALSALFGGVSLHLSENLADILAGRGTEGRILWSLRLPRIALAAVVGAALCASGSALQSLLQNPLADPFVLGVSGGAAVGGTLALLVGEWLGGVGAWGAWGAWFAGTGTSFAMAAGFVGALLSVALVRTLAARGGRISAAAALLAGAVLNAVAGALVLLAELAVSPERAQQILLWLSGSLGYPSWSTLALGAGAVAVGCAILWGLAGRLRLLTLGPDEAAQLGVDVPRTVRLALGAASLIVAAAVALSGLIGFVGLLVPHVLRLWLGPDQRLLLPLSIVFGAAFLVAADGLARLCFLPVGIEPPIGAVTALIGGPVFLWLLRRELQRTFL